MVFLATLSFFIIFQILRLVPVRLLSSYFVTVPIRSIFVAISITEKPAYFSLFWCLLVRLFVSGIFTSGFLYD